MPNAYSTFSRRWLAMTHRRQAALDDVLDGLDAAIRAALDSLAPALVRVWRASPPAERSARIDALVRRRIDQVVQAIASALANGRDATREALADAIPAALLPDLLGRLSHPQPIAEAVILSNDLDAVTPGTPAWNAAPLTPAQARQRIAQMVLPPINARDLARTFGQPTPAAAPLADRLSRRLWTPQARAQIESQLASGLAAGEAVEPLTRRIRSSTGAIAWQARRIARTEGRRALERDHLDRTLDALGDMVQGLMIQAVMDDRTRPEHAARHGTIYRRRPDGTFRDDGGRLAPDLPDAPNCRCTMVPVLDEPDLSEPARRAYETATDKLVPDLPTYQDVWEKADVKTRRRMIGAKRYDTLMQKYGAADPTLAMNEDGTLVEIAELQKQDIAAAHNRRARFLTRQLTLGTNASVQPADRDAAGNLIRSGRVLARQDLPVNLSSQQIADRIAQRVPTPSPQASDRDVARAVRRAVEEYTQAAHFSPNADPTILRDHIWRIIGRPVPATPARFRITGPASPALQQRVDQAIELVRRLVPDRQLPVGNIVIVPGHDGLYSPSSDTITISDNAPLENIVHEMMHRIDWKYTKYTMGLPYARSMLKKQAVSFTPPGRQTEEYQTRRDGMPGLYYYQNRRYTVGNRQWSGIEQTTTMVEQLVRNPVLAVTADPKGFLMWVRALRNLK